MYNPYYKLTTKDIANLNSCSIRSAERLKAEIKKDLKVKVVRYMHFKEYFGY